MLENNGGVGFQVGSKVVSYILGGRENVLRSCGKSWGKGDTTKPPGSSGATVFLSKTRPPWEKPMRAIHQTKSY